MNPLNHLNSIEQHICNKADLAQIPIAGNIELLPLCNMDCKMCFAKMTNEEMKQHHRMYDYKEWLKIGQQLSKAGTIFMLFTGGEPFLYPHFKELYAGYKEMGFIVSINTNGTLINEEIVEWLSIDPPRRLNITLYGASNETYAKLCNNPNGFTQVMNAVKLLKKKNIAVKFNCSLTPLNVHELKNMYQLSKKLDIPIEVAYYMFPPIRKNNIENVQYRLTAKEAALARFNYEQLKQDDFDYYVKYALKSYRNYKQTQTYQKGYRCRSGNSVFWINYDGTMSACSFTNDYSIDIFQNDFYKSWKKLITHVSNSEMSRKCHTCKESILCGKCAASAISETGDISGTPSYYCELTHHFIYLLEEYERNNFYENQ